MTNFRSLFSIPAALIVVFVLAAPLSAQASFADSDEEEVTALYEAGIITGYEDGTFRPDRNVSRAEASVMLARALEFNIENTWTSFSDVTRDHYAAAHIHAAVENSILEGYPQGTFEPDGSLTRAEMAAVLTRSFDMENVHDVSFSDVESGSFFNDYIMDLAGTGITDGYPDGTFRPDNSISRLEFSLMLARALHPEFRPGFEETDPSVDPGENSEAIGAGVVANSATLNVRPEPSTSEASIGRLVEGEEVTVFERTGNWARIKSDELEGYVSQSYLYVDYFDHESPLVGHTIAVDPGHGGSDPGAVANGLQEKEVVLDVGLRLEEELRKAGANVVMTRRSDWYPSLEDRVIQANNMEADIFISIHTNAAGVEAAHGTETFYSAETWAGNSIDLADNLQTQMLEKLDTIDRGVKERGFYVIKNTDMPSALAELAFKTNEAEAEKMKTDGFREDSSDALYEGIVDYFE
ncbi:N-acetylmuramoyl-L-alanine amidase [Alkalicoccus halolimnae]|uniref:N-acetylmuramoyl-L-alanine amidase n=1 Tax=Alkalicoccus halolimnae TaxID=1667239 RepID=A0A5C7F9J9_9BACI|nr:N-acetylmuramoyl-L-alanine amidase [Alkalicoccus halolimnae]TXF82292.1 SH3 domain-containing protein [Alkalicoccus halolimnae]